MVKADKASFYETNKENHKTYNCINTNITRIHGMRVHMFKLLS